MRAGMKLKDGELLYKLSCSRCRGVMFFSASTSRKDAVTKLLVNHEWTKEGKNLYCDGCSGMLNEDKPKTKSKKAKVNVKPKSEPEPKVEELEEDEDGEMWL